MGHQNLDLYFKNNFSLIQHHKWRLSELENMVPWEKGVYTDLLQQYLIEEERRLREMESAQRGRTKR